MIKNKQLNFDSKNKPIIKKEIEGNVNENQNNEKLDNINKES